MREIRQREVKKLGRGREIRAAAWAIATLSVLGVGGFVVLSLRPSAPAEIASIGITVLTAPPNGPLTTVHEDPVPSCTTCQILLTPVAHFGSISDSVLLRGLPLVERDSRDRFYAVPRGASDHEIIVYDVDGGIVRTIGRTGTGPGEIARGVSSLFVDKADSLYVAHDARISAFDSSGALAWSVLLEPPPPEAFNTYRIVDINREGLILNADTWGADHTGAPLRVYDRSGDLLREFGPRDLTAERQVTRLRRVSSVRIVSSAPDGSLWLTARTNYRMENVDLEGRMRRVIGVRAPPEWNTRLSMTREEAEYHATLPPPLSGGNARVTVTPGEPLPTSSGPFTPWMGIRGISPLSDSLLVVAITVPSTDWRTAELARDTTELSEHGVPMLVQGTTEQLYDTVLDVIHTLTGSVLARQRLPGLGLLTSDGTLYVGSTDDLGIVSVRAFTIGLQDDEAGVAEARTPPPWN